MRDTPYYRSATSIIGFLAGGLTGAALATLARAQPWREPARRAATPPPSDATDEGASSGDAVMAASAEPAPMADEPAVASAPKGPQD